MKLLQKYSLGLLALTSIAALAGCDLYFGGNNQSGSWTYCGSDGQYQCQDNNCTWVSPTCDGSGSGGSGGSGYQCTASTDCAAGCYCANGTCTEGGFCTQDSDCGSGYHCNTGRSSCEPNPPGCTADSGCPTGTTCDIPTGTCTATCTCSTDAQAVTAGYGYCDETRMTCMTGTDPNGSCVGTITCATAQPVCPAGQVPTQINGCWTGQCEAYAACDMAPTCAVINDETDCLSRTDCGATYLGINCQKPDGSACHSGDTNCTCASFVFNSCASRGTGRVINSDGEVLDIPAALTLH
jgi:hypothetical protein